MNNRKRKREVIGMHHYNLYWRAVDKHMEEINRADIDRIICGITVDPSEYGMSASALYHRDLRAR